MDEYDSPTSKRNYVADEDRRRIRCVSDKLTARHTSLALHFAIFIVAYLEKPIRETQNKALEGMRLEKETSEPNPNVQRAATREENYRELSPCSPT
ncbi:hypothetical protein KM043_004559 [Ampulex compressa]|nr:hypothetical protein KM043_004559 [Ampulex compressa]